MGKKNTRIQEALASVGATLKRGRKHLVYELPNGRNFVVAKSPSDRKGELNAMSDLKAATGIDVEARRKATPEARAERKRRPGRNGTEPVKWGLPAESSPFASALRESGVVEQQLRCRVGQLESEIAEKDTQIAALEGLRVVKAWRWLTGR